MQLIRFFRSSTKLLIAITLYYSGLLSLRLRWRYAQQGMVLLYHRVLPESVSARSHSSNAIVVTPATFARHLRVLRRHFSFVSPVEFEEWWRGKRRFSKPPCLISFDDGWKDNIEYARPILRAAEVPAVIFLPTDYIGTGRVFWQERLSGLLETLGRHPELRSHPLVTRLALNDVFQQDAVARSNQSRDVARRFKIHTPEQIDSIVTEVADLVRSLTGPVEPASIDAYLNWQDVQTMMSEDIHFGSHAVTHRILPRLDKGAVQNELSTSKQILEHRLGKPVRMLAYPNGDHDETTCRTAHESGYALAFTTLPGWVQPGVDPYRLKRINIHEGAHRYTALLYASILGIF